MARSNSVDTRGPAPRRKRRTAAIEHPLARVVSFGIFVACIVLLVVLYRGDFFPPEPVRVAEGIGQQGFAACYAERAAQVDNMVAEGVVNAEQAEGFKRREEAICADQAQGGVTPGPTLPGLTAE